LLAFLWPWIGLTRSLGCFLDVFGQKWVENEILDEKMKDPIFSAPQWLDSRLPKRVFFFFNYLGRTTRRRPHYTFFKK
jgi:hypothetical protein